MHSLSPPNKSVSFYYFNIQYITSKEWNKSKLFVNLQLLASYSTGFKINATAPQPQRTVLKDFALFKNIAHTLEPGETPSNSAGSKLCTTFLNLATNDEIMSKNQFTGTATQPQHNRKCCQFNKDKYCITGYCEIANTDAAFSRPFQGGV